MNTYYAQARYLTSAPTLTSAPPDEGREVAFAGRSNAGKSSALNALTRQRALARTSKTPGRTQLLNFFALDDGHRLVDLPGYGFARVPEAVKRRWQLAMADYLNRRCSLVGLILIMDLRHPLSPFDQQMLDGCQHSALPVHILLNKADKLKRGPALNTLHAVRRTLSGYTQVSVQLFSATRPLGVDEAHAVLDDWLELGNGATPAQPGAT